MSDEETVPALLARAARDWPRRPALETPGAPPLGHGELAARVESLAAWLEARGVGPGERVGVHLPRGAEEVLTLLATSRLGAAFVNVHPQVAVRQLREAVRDCGICHLVTSPRRAQELEQGGRPDGLRGLTLVGPGRAQVPGAEPWPAQLGPERPRAPLPAGEGLAALLTTSGSTGRARGVMHSQRNLFCFARNVSDYLALRETDRLLGQLPLSFGYGLNQLLTVLWCGGALVQPRSSLIGDVLATLADGAVTGAAGVSSFWIQLVTLLEEQPRALPALRYLTNAGGELPLSLGQRLRAALPTTDIVAMYGTTECLRSTFLPPADYARKPGSMGRAIPGVEVAVVADGGARRCAVDEVGELVHAGDHVTQGYWGDPALTAERLRPCPALGGRVAFFTGDLARADRDGDLWFVSRAAWMIKTAGFRFSSLEVETLLRQSGLVEEALVFGLPDPERGQAVVAAVRGPGGAAPDVEALTRWCRAEMPAAMVPRLAPWEGPFPLTPNGKLDRQTVRAALAAPGGAGC